MMTARGLHPDPSPGPADGRSCRLTAEEEFALARAAAAGVAPARAALIAANLGLVRVVARGYLGRGLELDDLVGEGCVGLVRAADGFDPSRGVRFGPYAGYWVRQAILLALEGAGAIRVPSHAVRLLARWRRAERALEQGRGGPPPEAEVAARLGLSAAQLGIARRARLARRACREADLAPAAGRPSLEAAGADRPPGARAEREEERGLLARRLARLDGRGRLVVGLRYGLDGGGPRTLAEVGRRLGVSREWARRLERRALRALAEA